MRRSDEISDRSYGTAVILCGLFGTLGVHHFYLRDYLHGIADATLLVLTVIFFMQDHIALGLLTLALDAIHTIIIFFMLITGSWRDGEGRLIAIPTPSQAPKP